MAREARKEDLDELLRLYLFLHEDSVPKHDTHLRKTWYQIIEDPNHHLIVNEIDGQIVSSCVCVIIPNLSKEGYKVYVISDCVTSYDLKKLDEMFAYYGSKGCDVKKLGDYTDGGNTI